MSACELQRSEEVYLLPGFKKFGEFKRQKMNILDIYSNLCLVLLMINNSLGMVVVEVSFLFEDQNFLATKR